jgi:signal transduction histidine kinase
MLSNLLSNALKFTPAGGRVHVALRNLPEAISLEVEDTGCGIPEEHIPHIFERFYRVPTQETCATAEPGLGLGLSFVAWIAKAHGGTIRVDSVTGKGTRFTVSLPAAAAEPALVEAVPAGAASGAVLG